MERSLEKSLERSPGIPSPSASFNNLSDSSNDSLVRPRSVRQSAKSLNSFKRAEFVQDSPKDEVTKVLTYEEDLSPMKQKQKPIDIGAIASQWITGKGKLVVVWFTFCLFLLYYFSPKLTASEEGFPELPVPSNQINSRENQVQTKNASLKSSELKSKGLGEDISSNLREIRGENKDVQKSQTFSGNADSMSAMDLPEHSEAHSNSTTSGKVDSVRSEPLDGQSERSGQRWSKELTCDLSHWATDVCELRGAVRLEPKSLAAVVTSPGKPLSYRKEHKIRPYPFKHSKDIMSRIQQVTLVEEGGERTSYTYGTDFVRTCTDCTEEGLEARYLALASGRMAPQENHFQVMMRMRRLLRKIRKRRRARSGEDSASYFQDSSKANGSLAPHCHVNHSVPGVIFSVGGYTGNPYHEWQNGIVPLWITAQQYKGNVSFVVLQADDWWVNKYMRILAVLSRYPLVVPTEDSLRHCFPHLTVGLRFHQEMAVDPTLMPAGETILDFQKLLKKALGSRKPRSPPKSPPETPPCPPVLLFMKRSSTRVLLNEAQILSVAQSLGFSVQVFEPSHETLLEDIWAVVKGADLLFGVHGAALTHFLFMRPGTAYVQVIPIGVEKVADEFLGVPAVKLGLHYTEYRVHRNESTLSRMYRENDPVFTDSERLFRGGKADIFLKRQNFTLDIHRISKVFENSLGQLRTSPHFLKQMKKARKRPECQDKLSMFSKRTKRRKH